MNCTFAIDDLKSFKQKVLNWLKQFDTFCFLDSNQYNSDKEIIIGAGAKQWIQSSETIALKAFQQLLNKNTTWWFGHLGYELATTDSTIVSQKKDDLHFPDLHFFEPENVLILRNGEVEVFAEEPNRIFEAVANTSIQKKPPVEKVIIHGRINHEEYIETVEKLKQHIQRGDCYEINYCVEFFAEQTTIEPLALFEKLNQISPNPFSGFYRIKDKWLLCASPERFLKKTGDKIISQPIKGTLKRDANENLVSEQNTLRQSKKDRAENVMVVDLVRNDLSRICKEGSVVVDELFGIYTFPQVHQMISTISGQLEKDISFENIINATFPMGSMTGAPKIKVMKLIDRYEKSKRGIFSGSIGYIDPQGNFDFNVVIRSLMYNQSNQYLSCQVGSGITIYSNAENEWEECLLKAKAIKEILAG